MVNSKAAVLATGFTLVAGSAFAADKLELLALEDEMLPEPQVTAEAVFVGLVRPRSGDDGAVASETILAAIPPAHRSADVCVRVTTEDGRYSGRARYRGAEGGASAMTLMDYVPEHTELKSYEEADVAVLTFPCSTASKLSDVAVATWRAEDVGELGPTVQLLVNSFRANAAFLIVNDAEQVDCKPTAGGERAAFDFVCPLQVSKIQGGARVALYRVRGASFDPEVVINVVGWE